MRREEVEEAFERYGPMVYRRARSILGNDEEARDVVQDVFIKVLSGRLKSKDGQVAGWLQTVTTHACFNLVRNRGRRAALLAERLRKDEPMTHDTEQQVLVRRLLDKIEPRTAEAAICVHIDGMSYDETSSYLGVSKRTVANLLARFREAARELLESNPKAVGDER